MNIINWFRRKQMRYYKAMMLLSQDEYLHAADDEFINKQRAYLTYKGKYEKLQMLIGGK